MTITQHLEFTYGIIEIRLIKCSPGQYELCLSHTFDSYAELVKLLPLLNIHQGHVTSYFRSRKDSIYICYQLNYDSLLYSTILCKPTYFKLKCLSNFDCIFNSNVSGYAYILHPNNLVYDSSCMPKIIYVGLEDILEPMEQLEDELLHQFKCLVIYTIKPSVKYEYLLNGAIHYIQKNSFEAKVYKTRSLKELFTLIKNEYYIERKSHMSSYYLMSKLETRIFSIKILIAIGLCMVALLMVIYLLIYDFSMTAF